MLPAMPIWSDPSALAAGGAALAAVPSPDLTRKPGGRGLVPDPERFDPAWPAMAAWAAAGVPGGIPADPPLCAFVQPGPVAELQAALDAAAASGGGTVLLAPGTHLVERTLRIPSGVLLRGVWADQVWLEGRMRHGFAGWGSGPGIPARGAVVVMEDAAGAGLAHLTVTYDRTLPPPPQLRRGDPGFADRPGGRDDLFVMGLRMERCTGCWTECCRFIDCGTNPVEVGFSRHCTVRCCEISGSHNQGGGQGYVHCGRSESCLFADLVVRDCRHLTIQESSPEHPCRWNVVIGCDLAVDVNFHSGDGGANLVQDCRIHCPSWHWWGPFAIGDRRIHRPPGPGNALFRNDAVRWFGAGVERDRPTPRTDVVYTMADDWSKPTVRPLGPAPVHGTLYAVRPAS
jgi:hypothetical protein